MGDIIVFPKDRVKRSFSFTHCADCGSPLEGRPGEQRCTGCQSDYVDERRKHLWSYIEHMILRHPH